VRVLVVAVGGLRDSAYRSLVDDYLGRIRRLIPVEEVEAKEGKLADAIARLPDGARIALESGGTEHTSEAFARALERLGRTGKGNVAFLIGGADGLPAEVVRAADQRWSLGKLTMPHRLARLVLVEQIYRAATILRGHPYAH
jgi:23S rRNA (pseudouridine1915-N3)-methyltransferase